MAILMRKIADTAANASLALAGVAKRVRQSALVTFLFSGLLASFLVALLFWWLPERPSAPLTHRPVGAQLGCADTEDDRDVSIFQGRLDVVNHSSGDSGYAGRVTVGVGDLVTFRLWLFNRDSEDLLNVRARLVPGDQPAVTIPVEAQVCGSNSYLLRDSASVDSQGTAVRLRFQPGSAYVRSFIDGNWATRGGSDAFFSPEGEALGRLEARGSANRAHTTVIATATVEAAE